MGPLKNAGNLEGQRRGRYIRILSVLGVLLLLFGAISFWTGDFPFQASPPCISLELEIADTPEKRARGLMERESLDPYEGMLFVFDKDVQYGFWMKNTWIPLSIAFLDEKGMVQEILHMSPCPPEEQEECPRYRPRLPYRYALEVPQGDFEKKNIQVGSQICLPRP